MGRRALSSRADNTEVRALGLLLIGLVSFCLAILVPLRPLLDKSDPFAVISGAIFVLPPETLIVSAGLLILSVSATVFGLLLLVVRL